jgi:membrane protease subunit (stomatin/prohibitin family)
MALLNVLKCEDNNILVWKWGSTDDHKRGNEIRRWSKIIVNQSQEAVFYSGGKIVTILGPGEHSLESSVNPFWVNFKKMIYGDSPQTAEIYFVNKAYSMNILWATGRFDLNYSIRDMTNVVPITAKGSFSIKVSDTNNFIINVVGVSPEFSPMTIEKNYRHLIAGYVQEEVGQTFYNKNSNPFMLQPLVREISDKVKLPLISELNKKGLMLDLFNISSISVIDDDPLVQILKDKLQQIQLDDEAERRRFQREEEHIDVYKTERIFNTTEKAAERTASGTGGTDIMGTMIGLNIGGAMANTMGKMMENSFEKINKTDEKVDKAICGNCQTPNKMEAKFCSSCGKELNLSANLIECPDCRTQQSIITNFCNHCGKPLKIICSSCNSFNNITSKFCNNCGSEFK